MGNLPREVATVFHKGYYVGKGSNYFPDYHWHRFKIFSWPILSVIHRYSCGGALLDAGCAFGYLLHHAKPYFSRVVGADVSPYAIAEARRLFPEIETHVADLGKLPFSDSTFDFVTAVDVLEHTADPSRAVAELSRVLKPAGIFYARMPYQGMGRKLLGWFDRDVSHISVLGKAEWLKLIEQHNLLILEAKTFLSFIGGNLSLVAQKINV